MNRLFATLLAIAAMSVVPSTSALLFSPLLLKANPWGVTGRTANANARTKTVKMPPAEGSSSSKLGADFSHDDDILRLKYELLGSVYEKSLNRGFDDAQDQ